MVVPTEVMLVRNQLHFSICKFLLIKDLFRTIVLFSVQNTGSFVWLLDVSNYPTSTGQLGTHPLFKNSVSTLNILSEKQLSLSYSTLAHVSRYEPMIYHKSVYEWLYDFAAFSILNPETARRLVINRSFIHLF